VIALTLIKHSMRAMMPRTAALPGIADTDLDGFLRRMRAEADTLYWLGLVAGAWVFTWSPLLTIRVPLPSFLLPARWLDRHANAIQSHPLYMIRMSATLVRLSAGMCWGADHRVRARFALPPSPADPGTFRTS
jgi:hypothetical protein